MTTGAVDAPVQHTHAAVADVPAGTDRPPGKRHLGMALVVLAPAARSTTDRVAANGAS